MPSGCAISVASKLEGFTISTKLLILCLCLAHLAPTASASRKTPRYSFALLCGGIIASGLTLAQTGSWPSRTKGISGSSRELLLQLKSGTNKRVMISREGAMVVSVPPAHVVRLSAVLAADLSRHGRLPEPFREAFRKLQDVAETLESLIPLPENNPDYTVLVPLEDLAWLLAAPADGFFVGSPAKHKALPVLSNRQLLRHVAIPVWLAMELVKVAATGFKGLFADLTGSDPPAPAWNEMRRVVALQVSKMKVLALAMPAFTRGEKSHRTDFAALFARPALAHLAAPMEVVFNHVWSREGEILFRPGPTAVDFIHTLESVTEVSAAGNQWPGDASRWSEALEYGRDTLVLDLASVAEHVQVNEFGPTVDSMGQELVAATARQFAAWVLRRIGFRTEFVLAAVMEKLSHPDPALLAAAPLNPVWAGHVSSDLQARALDFLRQSVARHDVHLTGPARDIRSAIHEFFLGHLILDWGTGSREELAFQVNAFLEHLTGTSVPPLPFRRLQELLNRPARAGEPYLVLDEVEKIITEHLRVTLRTPEQRTKVRLTLAMVNSALSTAKGELTYWLVRNAKAFDAVVMTPSYYRGSTVGRILRFEMEGLNVLAETVLSASDNSWPVALRPPYSLESYLQTNSAIALVKKPEEFVRIYFKRLFASLRTSRPDALCNLYPAFSTRDELLAIQLPILAEPFPELP